MGTRGGDIYVAGEVAVATVAEFLVAAGAFRTNAIAAGDGEVEKGCAVGLEVCLRARRAALVVCDRSMAAERRLKW
jgi:hypothetical protein